MTSLQIQIRIDKEIAPNQYRKLFEMKRINWCDVIKDLRKVKSNPLLKLFISITKDQIPDLFKPCPWSGVFQMKNFTVDRSAFLWFPHGGYRLHVDCTDDKNHSLKLFQLQLVLFMDE
jgi:hypothetical protein